MAHRVVRMSNFGGPGFASSIYPDQRSQLLSSCQVQPFGAMGGRFGDATDCIRFFTIPIWSTLLVSFLLLGILTYGLQMLSAIRPNELYDDPKQKMVQLGTSN
ncbi:V-type proton ATPase subunit S1 [Clonorchis sinensis]|uniref:V-type proton ATPase subunit S1 n=1 Tax=Clonorchis sinensis TaxID=79923 RepID=A0A8T1ML89_CLOSI|nr:V-type proton ATPase subunit S1 [Clonorchis sinensis]